MLCIFIFIYICYAEHKESKQSFIIQEKELTTLQNNLITYKSIISDSLITQKRNWIAGSVALNNVVVTDRNNNSKKLFDLINTSKFIFYIEPEMCSICIDKEILNIKKLAEYYGYDEIMILTSGFRGMYIFNDQKFENFENIFIFDDFFLKCDNIFSTLLIIFVDVNKTIRFAYNASSVTNENFNYLIEFVNNTNPLGK